jgi:mono/diheme cytochrome c family protein
MHDQPKYKPLRHSDFFNDGRTSRQLVPGTVPRGTLRENIFPATNKSGTGRAGGTTNPNVPTEQSNQSNIPAGSTAGGTGTSGATGAGAAAGPAGSAADGFPVPVTEALVTRGQERYNISCSPCHGRTGYGDGMIVRRGFPKPPSYHQDRLRAASNAHFYDVITNGFGMMYAYSDQVTPGDRWAIVAYIRALQLSQNARVADVPEAQRAQFGTATPSPGPAGQPSATPTTQPTGGRTR